MSGRALIVHTLITFMVQARAGGVGARDVQVAGCANQRALVARCGTGETRRVTDALRCVALCRGRQQPVAALSSRLCLCCGDLRAIETILTKECGAKCPTYKPDTIHQPPCNQENTFIVFKLRSDRKGRVKREWPPRRKTERPNRNRQRKSTIRKKQPTERPPKRRNHQHKKRPTEKPPKHKQRRPQTNLFKKQNSKPSKKKHHGQKKKTTEREENRRNERERGARGRSTVRPGGKLKEGEVEEPGATRPSPSGELPAGAQRLNQSASSANISSEFLNMTTSNVTTLLNPTAFLKILHEKAVKDRVMFELKKDKKKKKKKKKGKTSPGPPPKKGKEKKKEEIHGAGGPNVGLVVGLIAAFLVFIAFGGGIAKKFCAKPEPLSGPSEPQYKEEKQGLMKGY